MLLTKEVDYAMRVIRELGDGGKKSAKDICASEMMPEAFTYKILKKLEKAEMVKSIRGAQGGYLLTQTLNDICLADIVDVIDPHIGVSQCSNGDFCCERSMDMGGCCTNSELLRIQKVMMAEMRRFSLAQVFANENIVE